MYGCVSRRSVNTGSSEKCGRARAPINGLDQVDS